MLPCAGPIPSVVTIRRHRGRDVRVETSVRFVAEAALQTSGAASSGSWSRGTIERFGRGRSTDAGSAPMTLESDSSRRGGHRPRLHRPAQRCLLALASIVVAGGCTETLDAGYDRPNGLLPVDQRNPIILLNDGAYDNWSGEYAVLLANGGGSPLAGIIVNENTDWPDIQTNVGGYTDLVAAARVQRAHEPAGSDPEHRSAAGHAGERQHR